MNDGLASLRGQFSDDLQTFKYGGLVDEQARHIISGSYAVMFSILEQVDIAYVIYGYIDGNISWSAILAVEAA